MDVLSGSRVGHNLGFPAIGTFLNVIDVGPTADGLVVAAPFSDVLAIEFSQPLRNGSFNELKYRFSNLQMEIMSVEQ